MSLDSSHGKESVTLNTPELLMAAGPDCASIALASDL